MDISGIEQNCLQRPESYATIDDRQYRTHAAIISVHRDSSILEQSNFAVVSADLLKFSEDFESDEDFDEREPVYVANSSHWLVGWMDTVFVRVRDGEDNYTPEFLSAVEWLNKLEDYPIADEFDYSEREYDDAIETLINCFNVSDDDAGDAYSIIVDSGEDMSAEFWHGERVAEILAENGFTERDYS